MNKKDIKRVAKMSAIEVKEKAKKYVKNFEDYDVKHCGDFEVEDMEKAYTDGFNQGKESRVCDCITYLNFDTLEKENAGLREDNKGLREDNDALREDNEIHSQVCLDLRTEVDSLKKENEELRKENLDFMIVNDKFEKTAIEDTCSAFNISPEVLKSLLCDNVGLNDFEKSIVLFFNLKKENEDLRNSVVTRESQITDYIAIIKGLQAQIEKK